MITAGIDAGSRMLKVVLWDATAGRVLDCDCREQGVRQAELAADTLCDLLARHGIERHHVRRVVATGYGRNLVDADTTVTEISCHAAGVRHHLAEVRTIVEIGGQDSKFIRLDERGMVYDFAMNDRCAAGTGCFLEEAARKLEIPLDDLATSTGSHQPAQISSTCVVFAQTEIIGLLASGAQPIDIIAGVQAAVAGRVFGMTGGKFQQPLAFTGGVAMVPGMARSISKAFETEVQICPDPQFTGALGAALIAARS
jgi:(R)-2-hydroxyacyl-CoA dehydratese activating ATPase